MAFKAVHGRLLQKSDRISQGARTHVLTAVLAGVEACSRQKAHYMSSALTNNEEEHSSHLELQLAASKLLAAGSWCWSFVREFENLSFRYS